jgi:hypothetical protein
VRVESNGTPPASFVTRLTDFVQNNQLSNCKVELKWDTVPSDDSDPSEEYQGRERMQIASISPADTKII